MIRTNIFYLKLYSMVLRLILVFIYFTFTASGQQATEKGSWSVFGDFGYTYNYTKSKLITSNSNTFLKSIPIATRGLTYGFGIEYRRSGNFFSFKIKSVKMGYRFTIQSETDSLKYQYGLFVNRHKNNLLVSVVYGRIIGWKRFTLKPAIGIDYLPIPYYMHSSLTTIQTGVEDLFVVMEGKYNGQLPLLATANVSLGYNFKIRKRPFSVEYNISYSQGFSDLYIFSAEFYTKTRRYFFEATNKGSHLGQCIRLCVSISNPDKRPNNEEMKRADPGYACRINIGFPNNH